MTTSTESMIARFVAGLRPEDVPDDVLAVAAEACMDCVGVMLAGIDEPPARMMRAWLSPAGGDGAAAVLGTALRTTPADATLANGVAAHVLDYDDMGAFGHPSVVLLPPVLALGEARGVSGRRLLTAYAAGFEVGAALHEGLGISQGATGLHGTAMAGAFAAAAASANLLGLSPEQVTMAMAVAASTPAGLVQNFGTHTKSLHAGHTARNGLMAAMLAADGWTANPRAFEGAGGMLAVYGRGDQHRLRESVSTLGREWRLTKELTLKAFPCCGSTHGAVNAITALLRESGATIEQVDWLEVGELPPASHVLLYPEAHTGFEGKFSIEYVAARALCDRTVSVDSFGPQSTEDARYLAVKDKVRIRTGSKWVHGGEAFWGVSQATLRLTDGRTFHTEVNRYEMPGTRANPLPAATVQAKFTENCKRGGFDPDAAYAAWSRLAGLPDVREAVRTAVPR